jgi:uncharacterized membrane protein
VFSAFHVYFGPEALTATPRVRRIGPDDCVSALKEGFDDFFAMPTYPIFVGLFYAVAGIALFAMTSFGNALHLAFPLAAGFALIGPFVAIGLYEMSRRRERGLAVASTDALTVPRFSRSACSCSRSSPPGSSPPSSFMSGSMDPTRPPARSHSFRTS